MSMFEVETTYHIHSSGTKFYETVMISNRTTNQYMLVKRYGPVAKREGGGQVKIERWDGTRQSMLNERTKIIHEKERGNKDGAYMKAELFYGMQSSGVRDNVDIVTLKDQISRHYSSLEHRNEIRDHWTQSPGVTIGDVVNSVVDTSMPEPDRGETWGSW